jgi:hypothetical protein
MAALIFLAPCIALADADDFAPQTTPSPFTDAQIQDFATSAFVNSLLRSAPDLAFSDEQIAFWVGKAKNACSTLKADDVDTSKTYDVVLQVGHFPRTSGKTGGTGKHVTEQEVAALVATLTKQQLVAAGINAIVIGADGNPNLSSKVFLSFHTDSSANECSIGPSIGYDDKHDAENMKYLAATLAMSLGYKLDEFMKDNYTKNLRYYYGYKLADVSKFEGLLEMAELSCPTQEDNLLGNIPVLAYNLALFLQFSLKEPNL